MFVFSTETADRAHARFSSARGELLTAIADLSTSDVWQRDGSADLASWISARWQMSLRSARELVRDAEALAARPALADALSAGHISVDQCKALAILCEEGTSDDEVWLENLPFWSYSELHRASRKKLASELEARDGGIYFRTRMSSDERFMRGDFQVEAEHGAIVLAAIESRIPKKTPLREWERASALALVELAKGSAPTRSAERPMVLVTVSEDALADKPGTDAVATLGPGGLSGYVTTETARRLSCDARTQLLVTDANGLIVGTTGASRTIPANIRRAVEEREGGVCAFPDCQRQVFLDVHHIKHVARGGLTVLSNLVLLCWKHHTLVHEGGWSLRGVAGANMTWVRPDGTIYEPRVRVTLDTS